MVIVTAADAGNVVPGLQDEIRRSQEARYDHRLHGVLLVAQGLNCSQVAELLGDSPRARSALLHARRPGPARRTQENRPFGILNVDCEGRFSTYSPELLGLTSPLYGGFALGHVASDRLEDVLRILDEEGAPSRVVFHCYSGDAAMARVCAEAGYYLSFAGPVTFKANDGLREALRATPLDRVLVETDAPSLAPVPHRGRPNHPALLPDVGAALAAATGRTVSEIAAATHRNAGVAFRLPAT